MNCPCCGRELEDDARVRVSTEANTICYRGRVVALTRLQADIAFVLAKATSNVISRDAIIDQVWPRGTRRVGPSGFTHQINGIRRRIEPIGLSIQCVQGVGYRLIVKHV